MSFWSGVSGRPPPWILSGSKPSFLTSQNQTLSIDLFVPSVGRRNTSTAVFTLAYGLNTPAGRDTTASSSNSSTSLRRNSTCAVVDPNRSPSGTTTAQRPPGAKCFIIKPRKRSSLFLDLVGKSCLIDSFGNCPANGGFERITL